MKAQAILFLHKLITFWSCFYW